MEVPFRCLSPFSPLSLSPYIAYNCHPRVDGAGSRCRGHLVFCNGPSWYYLRADTSLHGGLYYTTSAICNHEIIENKIDIIFGHNTLRCIYNSFLNFESSYLFLCFFDMMKYYVQELEANFARMNLKLSLLTDLSSKTDAARADF